MDRKTKDEEIYEIISALKPDRIPPEFVSSGKVYFLDGTTCMATCEELEDIMASSESLEELNIDKIKLYMDLEKIVQAVVENTEIILSIIPE